MEYRNQMAWLGLLSTLEFGSRRLAHASYFNILAYMTKERLEILNQLKHEDY